VAPSPLLAGPSPAPTFSIGGTPSKPPAAATPAPLPGEETASSSPDARPASSAGPVAAATTEPAPVDRPSGGRTRGTSAEPAPTDPPAATAPGRGGAGDGEPRASRSPIASIEGSAVPGGTDDDGTTRILLLFAAAVSVGAIALLGTGWLLAARRRGGGDRSPATGAARLAAIEARGGRGGSRRAPSHDPVLAAMGLDPDADDPPEAGPRGD
jgi:hypothetical protein